jgi:signal transduction histidine kinase
MTGEPVEAAFTADVERDLARMLLARANPLVLEFALDWTLLDLRGDAARFGFDGAPEHSLRQLQELFLGMPLDGAIDLSFVEMPNGRSAHVHLDAHDDGLRVILLDAQDEHDRQRSQQQSGNEAVLVSHQKTKAIGQLRRIRSELEQQRARLQEANALKNALIATLSHDFRTPLTSIFGYLHLLEAQRTLDDGMRQSLRAVRRNATYLFSLAENLLEYGRSESGGAVLAPSQVDLPALVDDLEAMFRPLAGEKGLSFDVELDVARDAKPVLDEMRLRQVLANLLSNAVRYTLRGGVSLHLGWHDSTLEARVHDTGIGIPEEFRERVFVAFNSGGQGGSKGAGLGLSIVKRLIAQMHGSLELDSQLGVGSTFRVVLPALGQAEAHPASTVADGLADAWVHGRSALVVDDDPDIAQLLELLLGDLGFRVRSTGDAASAVAQALADPPDVLVVDVELPGLSGNTVVFRLRAQGYTGHIVTLSATPTEEARAQALAAGSNQYLTKPINIEQFVRAMGRGVRAR